MGIVDKIKELENEYARTQKNKATEGHLGIIKAKLSKLRGELLQDQAGSVAAARASRSRGRATAASRSLGSRPSASRLYYQP